MNSDQLIRILESHKNTSKYFLGVFARDEIPINVKYPSCFIINTHNRNQPGEHWLAFYVCQNGDVEFFDPIGIPPSFYNLNKYLEIISRGKIKYTMKRIQGYFSNYCGIYCVYFLSRRCRGDSFKQIIDGFSSCEENDKFIKNKIKNF